jgi:hypothetical protein
VEALRWFLLSTDFPGSAPVIDENGSYVALELKGAIKPNKFFYEATSSIGNNQCLDNSSNDNDNESGRSPYIEKRDQKLGSSLKLTKQAPRYLFVDHLLGTSSNKHSKGIEAGEETESLPDKPALSASLPSDECSMDPVTERSVSPGVLGGISASFSPNSLSDPTGAPSKPEAIIPPKKLLKAVGQAIADWSMIEEGDRLLLGLSGGKDSLALLHILLHVQKKAPINFTLACATVDPQIESYDPSPLIPYVQSLGVSSLALFAALPFSSDPSLRLFSLFLSGAVSLSL